MLQHVLLKRTVFSFLLLSFVFLQAKSQETLTEQASDTAFVAKLIQLARDNFPRIKMVDAEIRVAELNVTKTKISWLDVLSASYFRTQNLGGTINNSYLLNGYQYGVSLNIGSLLQKPANVKTAKQNLVISMLQKDEYDLALVKQVKQRYYVYLQHQANFRLLSGAVLDAENTVRSLNSKFEKGEETFDNYNKALMSLSEQNQAKLGTEANLLIAKAELEELIGTKIEFVKKD